MANVAFALCLPLNNGTPLPEAPLASVKNRLLMPSARRPRARFANIRMSSGTDWRPEGLLREAVAVKRVEVDMIEEITIDRPDHPISLRMSFYESRAPQARFTRALRRDDGTLAIIAMLKRFQPRPEGGKPERLVDLNSIGREARILEGAGVDAVMINTDSMRYGCEVAEIPSIAKQLARTTADRGMPIARHDLIIHPLQIAEAAVAGACAVNIVAAAALPELLELLNSATAMGIDAIVECHTELERDLAVECGATLLHLSNRDRTTNKIHPGRAESLRLDIPSWVVTIGGGGIVTARQAWSLMDSGFDAVVLGEVLLKSRRAADYIKEIRSQKRATGNPFEMDFLAKS
jgi:indole-3-glycerol phosphate synthase